MPGYLPSLGIAGVKIVNVHPDNPKVGLPTVMALTVILDLATGRPMAILNATKLTDMRTGAAGAIAAKYLAPKKECVLGVIGAGQAEAQVRATALELSLTQVKVWSRNLYMPKLLQHGSRPFLQKASLWKKSVTVIFW